MGFTGSHFTGVLANQPAAGGSSRVCGLRRGRDKVLTEPPELRAVVGITVDVYQGRYVAMYKQSILRAPSMARGKASLCPRESCNAPVLPEVHGSLSMEPIPYVQPPGAEDLTLTLYVMSPCGQDLRSNE